MKLKILGGAGLVAALGALAWGWLSSEWTPERSRAIATALGWIAAACLLATLGASLVKKMRPWRRALGITSACLALAHVVASFLGPLDRAWIAAWTWPRYRAGLGALLILAVLFATSFPKRFRAPEWKALHRLVYPAALLVVLHVAKLASAWLAVAIAILVCVFLIARGPRAFRAIRRS